MLRTVLLRHREGSCAHRGVVHVVQQERTSQRCCAEWSDVPCCRLYNVRTQYNDRYGTLPYRTSQGVHVTLGCGWCGYIPGLDKYVPIKTPYSSNMITRVERGQALTIHAAKVYGRSEHGPSRSRPPRSTWREHRAMHILMRDRRGCRWATGLCVLLTCVHAEALPRCELLYLDIGRSH